MNTSTVTTETTLIEDELGRATDGNAWHGPAIGQNLAGLSAAQASARPIKNAHTVWEIVRHLTAWATEVEARLNRDARPLVAEEDWPPVTASDEESWKSAKAALAQAHARLRATIREFPPSRLSETVGIGAEEPLGSFYFMLHGLAQHDAYHNGQIGILRKALLD